MSPDFSITETSTFVKLDFNKNVPEKMILSQCKVLSKVSRKICETQKLVNVLIHCIILYQTNEKCSHLHPLVCVFFFHKDCNVLTIFSMTIATSSYKS